MHLRRAPSLASLLFALFAALGTSGISRSDALDGLLEVRSAYASIEQNVLLLFARVAYPVNDDIRAALKDGLTLTFDLDVVISRERRFWLDADVQEYTIKRELSYHAVSDKYLTRGLDEGPGTDQQTYASLEEALEDLGTVDGYPLLTTSQLSPNRQYRISLRAGVRRGHLADSLQVILFWTDDWHRESEWFSWSLQR
jgi:hypothetical protein